MQLNVPCIQLLLNRETRFAEVQFYFQATSTHTAAVVSLFGLPDADMLHRSLGTVWVCGYHGNNALQIVNVRDIVSVIGMVPFPDRPGYFFAVEKPGLDVLHMAGIDEEDPEL